MLRAEATEVIARPIGEVWAYLGDPRNELEWQSSAVEREPVGGGPQEKGSRVRSVDRLIGRKLEFLWEVTEHEPPTRVAYRIIEGPFQGEMHLTLEPVEEGTKVTMVGEAPGLSGFFGKLADPIVLKIFQRELVADLGKAKDLLEAEA
ncbi:MAG: SRPBCC family protein [Actinobacteria bacterium]|nr:SRPBCC family protein [Actinomycetota bacterium]